MATPLPATSGSEGAETHNPEVAPKPLPVLLTLLLSSFDAGMVSFPKLGC